MKSFDRSRQWRHRVPPIVVAGGLSTISLSLVFSPTLAGEDRETPTFSLGREGKAIRPVVEAFEKETGSPRTGRISRDGRR